MIRHSVISKICFYEDYLKPFQRVFVLLHDGYLVCLNEQEVKTE